MRIDAVLKLAFAKWYDRLPDLEQAGKLWFWWLLRKSIFYGTCIYAAETILGHHRRPLGSNPLRRLGYHRWLPKTLNKKMDEETRICLKHLGLKIMESEKVRNATVISSAPKEIIQFYADVPFQPPLTPICSDEPIPPVEGEPFPIGFQTLKRALRIFGYFPPKDSIRIFKACEVFSLKKDHLACDFGDVDNSFLVIVSGSLSISIQDPEFGHILVNSITDNEYVMSLMVLTNYIIGNRVKPKPVQAVADVECLLLKVHYETLKRYFWEDAPDQLVPFLCRMLTKLRTLYFEGLAELAGIHKHVLVEDLDRSRYEPFDHELGDKENAKRMIKEAQNGISKYFPVPDEDLNQCKLGALTGPVMLTTIGMKQTSLIYVYKGELEMVASGHDSRVTIMHKEKRGGKKYVKFIEEYKPLFYQNEGTVIGMWGMVTNSINYYAAMVPKGKTVIVFEVPEFVIKKNWHQHPMSSLSMMKALLTRWSPLAQRIDYSVQWLFVAPGKVIYRTGDPKIQTFLVTNGRLRFKVKGQYMYDKRMELEAKTKFGHYEAGEWFGFVECVNSAAMQKTVVADRYSEIVTLPLDLVTLLYQLFPNVIATMTSYLSLRVHKDYVYEEISPPPGTCSIETFTAPKFSLQRKPPCSILAVFPLAKEIPSELYCQELCRHYPVAAKFASLHLLRERVGNGEDENVHLLSDWIHRFGRRYDNEEVGVIVLVGTPEIVDLWNTFIAREADFIHILALKTSPIRPTKLEKMIEVEGWKALRSFIFLHPAQIVPHEKSIAHPYGIPTLGAPLPTSSYLWLNRRPWLDMHHHVRFPHCAFKLAKSLNKKHYDEFEEYRKQTEVDKHCDIARVGRWLSNQMVGFVLGGGGAKGAAHLGTLEYISQLDLPMDYVTGVSIGAFVGGLLALYKDTTKIEMHLRQLLKQLEKPSRYFADITIPYTSMYRGRCFDEFIQSAFGNVRMEDLWIPFFPVTTDITGRHSRAHKHGQMWFFIRASMTLTMVFPPQISPKDGHLLMDGGYSEILPGNHLRASGVRYILAMSIGDQNGIPLFNVGYECSGIKCIWQNSLPIGGWPNVPSRIAFWEQLNYIAARKYVHLLKRRDKRLVYVRPAVEFYNGRDFKKVDEIKMMSYYITKKRFGAVRAGLSPGVLWSILNSKGKEFDSGSSDENSLIYQAQTYNFVPNAPSTTSQSQPKYSRYSMHEAGDQQIFPYNYNSDIEIPK